MPSSPAATPPTTAPATDQQPLSLSSFPVPTSSSLTTRWKARLHGALSTLLEEIKTRGEQDQLPSHKTLAAAALIVLVALGGIHHTLKAEPTQIYANRNELTELVIALLCRDSKSGLKTFRPGVSGVNGHLSTVLGFLRRHPAAVLPSTRELVETEDGGHFSLDWFTESTPTATLAATRQTHALVPALREDLRRRPIVLILHGVNDHGQKAYMRHLAHVVCEEKSWRAALMTFRGCGDLTLTSPYAYDASNTADLSLAVDTIHGRFPDAPLFLVGFSLGANVMVKYLGETQEAAAQKVTAAVSISNPWCFLPHIESLHYTNKPRSFRRLSAWIYSVLVAFEYKKYVRRHQEILKEKLKEVKEPWENMRTLRELDEAITVPLNGWRDLKVCVYVSLSS